MLATSIDGQCPACLLRLATLDDDDLPEPSAPLDDLTALAPDGLAGRKIGNYALLAEMARGGMGIVYRARQAGADRLVALKLMLPALLGVDGMLERFRLEVEAAARLDHPGILPIYEVGESGGLPYFSMKLAEGGSLEAHIHEYSGQWQRIAELMARVALAVEHAHQRGVLHRDIKPANILFDREGRPYVADFGLAKFLHIDSKLTLSSAALGSPQYMAPEQLQSTTRVGPAADVYSLGAVLYELLTGQPPIVGAHAIDTIARLAEQPVVPASKVRWDVPAALEAIARRCLEKQPEARYASAAELAADLERCTAGEPTRAERDRKRLRYRSWASACFAGLLTIAAVAGGSQVWKRIGEADALSSSTVAPRAKSLALLPLQNPDGRDDDEYLRSSVTDDLLRELRQIESLRVVPVRIDDAQSPTLTEIHQRYGADIVLSGSFHRNGERLEVQATLTDAASGRELWQKRFDVPAGDVRELRSRIAEGLVTQLQIEIGADMRAGLASVAPTNSPQAYEDYLRARYLIRWRRPETLDRAAVLLRRATTSDPAFAQAHSALAYVYALWIGDEPKEGEHWDLAREFARRALELDPRLSEPHAVLANYHMIHGNYLEAADDFRTAAELDPRDPATLHLYAIHLYAMGYFEKARDYERRSVALDSASPQPMMWLAVMTTRLGELQDARRLWEETDRLGAARPLCAAIARMDIGQDDYLPQWYRTNHAEARIPAAPRDLEALADGVKHPAGRERAIHWLRSIEPQADPGFLMTHFGMLEATDDAYRVAASFDIVADRNYLYQLCNIWSPRTASLRRDQRFPALMERWGFARYWQAHGAPDACRSDDGVMRCE